MTDKLVQQPCEYILYLNNYETIFTAQSAPPPAQPSDA
jgi:hypothetical protein